jgi:hypothetical protein
MGHWGKRPGAFQKTLGKIIMSRALTKITCCVCIASLAAALAGCADTAYPSLPGLPSSENQRLLTPSEQEKTIRDIGGDKVQFGQPAKPDGGAR